MNKSKCDIIRSALIYVTAAYNMKFAPFLQSAIQVMGVFVAGAPKSPTVRYAHLTCQRAVGSRQATIFAMFCVSLSSRLARDAALPLRKTTNQLAQIYCFSTFGAISKNKFFRLPGVYIDPYEQCIKQHCSTPGYR